MFYAKILIDVFSTPLRLHWKIFSKFKKLDGLTLKITRRRIVSDKFTGKLKAAEEKQVYKRSTFPEDNGFVVDRRATRYDSFEIQNLIYKVYILRGDEILFSEEKRANNKYTNSDKMIINYKRRHFSVYGKEIFLFQKVRQGIKCSCWNDILDKAEDPNCAVCGGTGYFDGFFDPVMTKVFFNGKPNHIEAMIDGSNEQVMQQEFSMPDFPFTSPGDFIVDEFGKRYIVDAVNSLGSSSSTLELKVNTTLLPSSHRFYQYKVAETITNVLKILTEG